MVDKHRMTCSHWSNQKELKKITKNQDKDKKTAAASKSDAGFRQYGMGKRQHRKCFERKRCVQPEKGGVALKNNPVHAKRNSDIGTFISSISNVPGNMMNGEIKVTHESQNQYIALAGHSSVSPSMMMMLMTEHEGRSVDTRPQKEHDGFTQHLIYNSMSDLESVPTDSPFNFLLNLTSLSSRSSLNSHRSLLRPLFHRSLLLLLLAFLFFS